MSTFNLGVRNSGRTSRMIVEAVRQAILGKAVYIVFANRSQADNYKPKIDQYVKDGFIPKGSIKLESFGSVDFDWVSGTGRGSDSSTVWLFDHCAIENNMMFQKMYSVATRFNAPVFVGDNDHGDALPFSEKLMKRIVELENKLAKEKKSNAKLTIQLMDMLEERLQDKP